MFDKLISQSIAIDNKKKILYQDNIIEYKQLMFAVKNVDINLKSSFFEIRHYQKFIELLILKIIFDRVIKKLMQNCFTKIIRIQ